MRYTIVLVLALFMFGCGDAAVVKEVTPLHHDGQYPWGVEGVVEIEGCEYFHITGHHSRNFEHKGNCKNPIHHKVRELTDAEKEQIVIDWLKKETERIRRETEELKKKTEELKQKNKTGTRV